MPRRLDAASLHRALDEKRQEMGLTWSQVAVATGVSAGTIGRLKTGGRMEVDGMLALVGWLGRPVEDFVHESHH